MFIGNQCKTLKKQSFLLKLRVWEEMSIPHRELAIVTSISEVTIHIAIDSKGYSHPHLFKGLFGGGSNPYLFSIYIYMYLQMVMLILISFQVEVAIHVYV